MQLDEFDELDDLVLVEYNPKYDTCPECGYVNKNQPNVCPSCGCDLKEYRDDLYAKEQALEAAEQAREAEELARAAELAGKAYSFICDTMDGITKDDNKDCLFAFIAAFLDGSNIGKFTSDTNRFVTLLRALYRYYDENKDEANERYYDGQGYAIYDCYSNALDLMARYLSSSKNNRLKSAVDSFTLAYGIECFFDLIITELELEKAGASPFKEDDWLGSAVSTFMDRFKKDAELSADDELNNMVEQYITHLSNNYEAFSDYRMEDFGINEEEDGCYENWIMNCPHCDAALKLITVKQTDKIKCAACGKSFMFDYDIYCPECGASSYSDHPFGINSAVCETCGLKYDVELTDPDDDEGAIDSVLDDGSET